MSNKRSNTVRTSIKLVNIHFHFPSPTGHNGPMPRTNPVSFFSHAAGPFLPGPGSGPVSTLSPSHPVVRPLRGKLFR